MANDRALVFEAALNGVLGDYLAEQKSELAIELGFYHRRGLVPLTAEGLAAAYPTASPKVCVLVHGSSYDESCWSFSADPNRTYGSMLEAELGFTPLYLRYNSGLHVSVNGRGLALIMERLVEAYAPSIEEITFIGHSMGGLLIRSACHYGLELAHRWPRLTRRAIYLGSPHLGSPHEKAGHLVSLALDAIPDPVVQLVGSLANLRSAGVKDLRHGSLVDEDWQNNPTTEGPRSIPLNPDIDHYLVAATLGKSEGDLLGQLLGDALVRLPSAMGPGKDAGLGADHYAVYTEMNHMQLVHDEAVYARIRGWCGASGEAVNQSPAPTTVESSEPRRPLANAYRALIEDAVDKGASAIQQVQEELTARPYDLLAQVPQLESPVKVVRAVHFGVMRGTYETIRVLNRFSGAALDRAFKRKKPV